MINLRFFFWIQNSPRIILKLCSLFFRKIIFKETRNSYFCITPPKSGALRVCIIFSQITQKILTKDLFHWLELVTEILSLLQIFTGRKATIQFFLIFQKNDVFGIFWPLKANYRKIMGLLTLLCFFLTLITVFLMFSTMYSYLFLLFSRFVVLFSPCSSYSFCHETHSTICNVWFDFITIWL